MEEGGEEEVVDGGFYLIRTFRRRVIGNKNVSVLKESLL